MGIRDIALLASRGVLGGYLAAHGAQKLFGTFGGHGIEPTAAAFEGLGLRPGRVTATTAGLAELGGGVLTAAGLASPVGPVAIAGTMVVASVTHRAGGPFAADRGYELPATNLAAAVALAAVGPGRYSLDDLTGLRLHRIITGTVVAGAVAGAAVNVAMLLRAARAQAASAPAAEPPAAPAENTGPR
ncbi:MAG TPA: DoxX family protein [Trebonia sp.]|jgi:putative oxidoreductase|nr:DoxX family protein [Trebonia sp.]